MPNLVGGVMIVPSCDVVVPRRPSVTVSLLLLSNCFSIALLVVSSKLINERIHHLSGLELAFLVLFSRALPGRKFDLAIF